VSVPLSVVLTHLSVYCSRCNEFMFILGLSLSLFVFSDLDNIFLFACLSVLSHVTHFCLSVDLFCQVQHISVRLSVCLIW
jgi:hypothetical protein